MEQKIDDCYIKGRGPYKKTKIKIVGSVIHSYETLSGPVTHKVCCMSGAQIRGMTKQF